MWVLQVCHHHSRHGQHKTAENLLSVVVDPGVGKADAGAVQRYPCTPLQFEHETAHAEDHGKYVHVIWRWVITRRSRCWSLVPVDFVWATRVVDIVGMHLASF